MAPAAWAPSTATTAPRSWASRAIASIGSRAPVVHSTCERTTSRVPGRIASSNAARIRSSSPSTATRHDLRTGPGRDGVNGPERARMLGVGRHDPIAAAEIDRPGRRVHRRGRRVGDRDLVDVGADHRGDRATGLGEPLEEGVPVVHRRAADAELVVDDLGHRGGRLGGHRPDGPRVQVDARAERRQRGPDRGHLLGIGEEGRDHAPMISAMSSPPAGRRLHRTRTRTPGGLARPELLASTDWLADQLGRPDVRILDVRWRPDGSGHQVWAAGHIPGAVFVDWRTDLTDTVRIGRDAAPGRTGAGRPDAVARRRRRRRDRRGLRRHGEPVRRPRLVEPPGLRPRVASASSTAASRRGRRRTGPSRTPRRRRRPPTSRRGPSRGCASPPPTSGRCCPHRT